MTSSSTTTSSDIERWIESFGLTFEFFEATPIDAFDEEASLRNQARRQPLNTERVVVYSQAMRAGSMFPAVVAHFVGPNLVLIDGNHRWQAAKRAGATHIAVYVVDVEPHAPIIQDMVASANVILNGMGAAEDDKLRHAMRMVHAGTSMAAAARLCGVSDSTIGAHLRAEKVKRYCERFGLRRAAEKLPVNYLAGVAPVVEKFDGDQLRQLFGAADAAKNGDEFTKLGRRIADLSSDDSATAVAAFCAERTAINSPTKTKTKRRDTPGWQAFKMHAQALANLSPEAVTASCPSDQLESLRRLAEEVRYLASRVATP